MSFLIFAYRKQQIIRLKNELSFKLNALTQRLMDLQRYSASISDNTVSLNDLIQSPPSMFNRMSIFMMSSHQVAQASANDKFPYMQQMMLASNPQFQDPKNNELKKQYENSIYLELYNKGREERGKQEEKLLNMENLKIDQEKAKIADQLKLLDAEEEKVSTAEDAAAKKTAPNYVA